MSQPLKTLASGHYQHCKNTFYETAFKQTKQNASINCALVKIAEHKECSSL